MNFVATSKRTRCLHYSGHNVISIYGSNNGCFLTSFQWRS